MLQIQRVQFKEFCACIHRAVVPPEAARSVLMGLGSSLASLCFRDHSSVTFPRAALLSLCLKFISGVFHQNIPGTLEWIHLSSGKGLFPPLQGVLVLCST